MKSYPDVLTEGDTIRIAQDGASLARYGDGEFKLCLGANCVSQRYEPGIAHEMRQILTEPVPGLLVCIPNINDVRLPRNKVGGWAQYAKKPYLGLLGPMIYGSSFVSRPDSAPWIDTPEYWDSVKALWRDRDVILATGRYNEIRLDQMEGAASVTEIECPRQHAYADIGRIQRDILDLAGTLAKPLVVMCIGPTATVLAARLQRLQVQALDLGHLGMFMRHAGQYRVQLDHLITMGYQDELLAMHEREKGWGGDGAKHADVVRKLREDFNPLTILDYGCGRGKLREALKDEFRILEYDPGVPGKSGMPKPVDLVICTDVMEHVEPKMVANVLAHIERVAEKVAYFVISTKPANAVLPGGRNAHLSVHEASWWATAIEQAGFRGLEVEAIGSEVRILARRAR